MTRVKREDAIDTLRTAGMVVSDYDTTIYADADCDHCGSRYKVGELDVEEGTVDETELEAVLESFADKS